MRNETLNIIIGIIGLGLTAWPLLQKGAKYFEHPFCEYDTAQSDVYVKRVRILWKANWLGSCLVIIIAYYNHVKVELNSTFEVIALYSILAAGVVIKDTFHNIFAYRKGAEKGFTKLFDSLESLNLLGVLEFTALVAVIWTHFGLRVTDKGTGLLITLIILELYFCIFRMLEEMCDLIHIHKVNRLSIKMNDGTIYEKVISYEELRNSIRIMTNSNTVLFISKNAISSITKDIDKLRLLDIVRKSIKKSRPEKAERNKFENKE